MDRLTDESSIGSLNTVSARKCRTEQIPRTGEVVTEPRAKVERAPRTMDEERQTSIDSYAYVAMTSTAGPGSSSLRRFAAGSSDCSEGSSSSTTTIGDGASTGTCGCEAEAGGILDEYASLDGSVSLGSSLGNRGGRGAVVNGPEAGVSERVDAPAGVEPRPSGIPRPRRGRPRPRPRAPSALSFSL